MKRRSLIWIAILAPLFACGNDNAASPDESEEIAPLVETSEAESDADDAARLALANPPTPMEAVSREVNARRGRILFITNGCVICHQINGVGGAAAPALDGRTETAFDPLEFSARMWKGARAMTALQSLELGYVIDLPAQDIADLAAFAASEDERVLLTLNSVPSDLQDWFLNDPYWKTDEWNEYLERGARIPFDTD